MGIGVIGRKLGMTRVFAKDGTAVPVTVVQVPTNYVVQVKSPERDGYRAVQVGAIEAKEKHLTKPLIGHFTKRNIKLLRYLKEYRIDNPQDFQEGQELKIEELFKPGDLVDVVGTSKGRGFAGTMKRWDFGGFPKSHGHRYHRAVGSIGNRTDPGRVWKGKKMAGHWGSEKVRVQALLVVDVIPEEGLLLLKGSVPGPNKGLLFIEQSRIAGRKKQQLKQNRLKAIVEGLGQVGAQS
ncbi:LSU ribosomal protein L3P [Hydrogenivirga caldilitoris]|uniref:Large ribosomal subunit protein uL3 n=1 Tax=Hydrogenivirga caldilitoris TaxID=246264 RepID=A0A497XLU0_9AQUI|nr:50S ribosomal protein L3 [Hydrogenivirga caldilitoris]RLJ69748.1 LSU ribosomal protein L3P [Hydrogenivirga caldilitoris]